MKALNFIYTALLFASVACSNGTNATDAELKAARDAGRKQAEAVLALPENSMEREKAILEIRARETRLRDAGFEDCADVYIESAADVLGFKD